MLVIYSLIEIGVVTFNLHYIIEVMIQYFLLFRLNVAMNTYLNQMISKDVNTRKRKRNLKGKKVILHIFLKSSKKHNLVQKDLRRRHSQGLQNQGSL